MNLMTKTRIVNFIGVTLRARLHRLRFNDLAAIVFLAALAGILYFPQADRLGLGMDAFLAAYFEYIGYTREPSRPFLELGWHLATALTGGSVTGYNIFQFSCLLLSSVLVYFLVRIVLPQQPVWALLASTLKLSWSANFEVFDNSGLAIYFAESLLFLAILIFTLLTTKFKKLSWTGLMLPSVALVTCLVVVVGTYQTFWPLILFVPLALMVLGIIDRRNIRTRQMLTLWYLFSLPLMIFGVYKASVAVGNINISLGEYIIRLGNGILATTSQSLSVPFSAVPTYSTYGVSGWVVFILCIFFVLFVLMGLQTYPALREKSFKTNINFFVKMIVIGLIIIVITLLPPLLINLPNYGTRVMHVPALGSILLVVAALAALFSIHRIVGGVFAAVIGITLVAGMVQQTYNVGNHYAINGYLSRRFWEDISIDIKNIEDDTIVVMDEPPVGIAMYDGFSTWVLRAMTETSKTYFITGSKALFDKNRNSYTITSTVDLSGSKKHHPGVSSYLYDRVFPVNLTVPETFYVSADRVITVKWNISTRRVDVLPEKSAMVRLHRGTTSVYGSILFPKSSVEFNRTQRDNKPPL